MKIIKAMRWKLFCLWTRVESLPPLLLHSSLLLWHFSFLHPASFCAQQGERQTKFLCEFVACSQHFCGKCCSCCGYCCCLLKFWVCGHKMKSSSNILWLFCCCISQKFANYAKFNWATWLKFRDFYNSEIDFKHKRKHLSEYELFEISSHWVTDLTNPNSEVLAD